MFTFFFSDKGILEARSKETADIILFLDKLFDSVNSGFYNMKKRSGKELLGPLTSTSPLIKEHGVILKTS